MEESELPLSFRGYVSGLDLPFIPCGEFKHLAAFLLASTRLSLSPPFSHKRRYAVGSLLFMCFSGTKLQGRPTFSSDIVRTRGVDMGWARLIPPRKTMITGDPAIGFPLKILLPQVRYMLVNQFPLPRALGGPWEEMPHAPVRADGGEDCESRRMAGVAGYHPSARDTG
jgi:hypothetical protein